MIDLKKLSFDWDDYDGKLKSFNKSQIMDLMDDYYNSDLSVEQIKSKYGLGKDIWNLPKEFPLAFSAEQCPYDDSNLVIQMSSRSSSSPRIPQCPTCGHKLKGACNCSGCQDKKRQIQERKREAIILSYPTDVEKVEYESLSAVSKVFLSALLHAGLNEAATKISGEKIVENKLSPTVEFDRIILDHLLHEEIILVDPMSPIEAFCEEDFPEKFYPFEVDYLINVKVGTKGIGYLEYPERANIVQYPEECLGLWKQIALYECLEYLIDQLEAARFEFNPQEKTKMVINHLLEEYSIGQIWNLIYGSVNNAAAWYQKANVSRRHAANSAITTLNNRGDRAKAEGWHLKPYHRSYNSKLSQLSMVFFDSILQIGSEGYEKVPALSLITD